jgi:hypothetical protein
LKANFLGSFPIQGERHISLNSSQEIVDTASLDSMLDKKIKSVIAEQFVSKAYRVIRKRGDRPFLLWTVFYILSILLSYLHPHQV